MTPALGYSREIRLSGQASPGPFGFLDSFLLLQDGLSFLMGPGIGEILLGLKEAVLRSNETVAPLLLITPSLGLSVRRAVDIGVRRLHQLIEFDRGNPCWRHLVGDPQPGHACDQKARYHRYNENHSSHGNLR